MSSSAKLVVVMGTQYAAPNGLDAHVCCGCCLQVLVATAVSCWGMSSSAKLVVVVVLLSVCQRH
jgi:hypothetical protein